MSGLASLTRNLRGGLGGLAGVGQFRSVCKGKGGTDSSQGSFPLPWAPVLCTVLAQEVADGAVRSW